MGTSPTTGTSQEGATLVADRRGLHGPGTGWYVMADPEGNEFCILKSDAEYAAAVAGQ